MGSLLRKLLPTLTNEPINSQDIYIVSVVSCYDRKLVTLRFRCYFLGSVSTRLHGSRGDSRHRLRVGDAGNRGIAGETGSFRVASRWMGWNAMGSDGIGVSHGVWRRVDEFGGRSAKSAEVWAARTPSSPPSVWFICWKLNEKNTNSAKQRFCGEFGVRRGGNRVSRSVHLWVSKHSEPYDEDQGRVGNVSSVEREVRLWRCGSHGLSERMSEWRRADSSGKAREYNENRRGVGSRGKTIVET